MIVKVYYRNQLVGNLAEDPDTDRIYFEYDGEFIKSGIELSPEYLPLGSGVFYNEKEGFQRLPGLFYDSLPDAWGTSLMEIEFEKRGIPRDQIKPLDRLCYMGNRAIGALSYQPDTGPHEVNRLEAIDFAKANREARAVISGRTTDIGRELIEAGGSAGGARAKVLVGISEDGKKFIYAPGDLPEGYQYWLVKLDENPDRQYGILEYVYSKLARKCGITVPETRLLHSKDEEGNPLSLFAVKRFDRTDDGTRLHIHTLAGMAHYNFNLPGEPYDDLLRRCQVIVKDSQAVHQVFRRMLFNILFANCDDHGKNHSFLMTDDGAWHLAPAYDLTYSTGPNKTGLHQMTIAGKRTGFTREDIDALGGEYGIGEDKIIEILNEMLAVRRSFAVIAGKNKVSLDRIKEIVERSFQAIRL